MGLITPALTVSATVTGATLGAGEAHIGEVGGHLLSITAAFARPADTTAYAAADAISDSTSAPTVITFANAFRVATGSAYLVKARVITDNAAFLPRLRLHLFNASPTLMNDNAAYTLLYADRAKQLGYVDIPALTIEGAGGTAARGLNAVVAAPLVAASGATSLFALLETLDAATPASGQNFSIELTFAQN